MSQPTSVAVIGAGAGGQVIAARLAERAEVTLLCPPGRPHSQERRDAVAAGGIEVEGAEPRTVPAGRIRAILDPAELGSPSLVVLVTPSTGTGPLTRLIAPHLSADTVVLVVPGRTGGALEAAAVLRELGREVFAVAETSSLPFTGRMHGPNRPFVAGVKASVSLAAIPGQRVAQVAARCADVATFTPVGDVVQTSLMNAGVTVHVAGALMNVPPIENGTLEVYYRDGVSPGVARLMEAADAERCRIAEAFGSPVPTATDYLNAAYGLHADNLYDAIQGNPAYGEIGGLDGLGHRYLSDDLPASAVPMAALARVAGVDTPVIDALITLGDAVTDRTHATDGRTLDRMGIAGLDAAELLAALHTGEFPAA